MPNMQQKKTPAPEQAPEVRKKNWDEVAGVYTEADARNEAARCLNCKNRPCMSGCPVAVRIPEFIAAINSGDYAGAYKLIRSTNALPAVCGRVCPQERQCESKCVRGLKGEPVAIGRLERFVADWAAEHPDCLDADSDNNKSTEAMPSNAVPSNIVPSNIVPSNIVPSNIIPSNGRKAAVIGSGPAGLTCAAELAKSGWAVTIFEALHLPGGVLSYGIPEFRLPKSIVRREIDNLKQLGVVIETNVVIGRTLTVDEIFGMGYEAVFIGSGAGLPMFLGIPGENANGVYSANEYLTRCNLMGAYKPDSQTPIKTSHRVAVVGGGNVAMDAARCAKRLGAEEVHIVYRRGEEELPARAEEVHHAKEEGIIFDLLTNPEKIDTDEKGAVTSITCARMTLGEPDASGRRSPVKIDGSEFDIAVDTVIVAVGTSPNPLIRMSTPGLDANKKGCLVTLDDGVTTSKPHVYAGGDAVTGAATVILAMGAGRSAAAAINAEFAGK